MVADAYEEVAGVAGVTASATHVPARAGELARSSLDPSLAGEVLGWKPQTALHVGAAAVLDWFRSQP